MGARGGYGSSKYCYCVADTAGVVRNLCGEPDYVKMDNVRWREPRRSGPLCLILTCRRCLVVLVAVQCFHPDESPQVYYTAMSKALNATGHPMWFNTCEWYVGCYDVSDVGTRWYHATRSRSLA